MTWETEPIAQSDEEVRARHAANRTAWNEGATIYEAANQQRVQDLKANKSNLHPIERRNLARHGPFSDWCQRAIHLQCASGQDSLSLLIEGVQEVIGVDISDVHIANARWTSEQLGWAATWYRCDILDTPSELNETADLVYTGQGALCWLQDIDAWAAVVYRLLKPGGIFHVLDDHPASWLFDPDANQIHASGINYFTHAEKGRGWGEQYIGNMGKEASELALKYERLWPISTVFQALTNAGLVVDLLGEYPDEYWLAFPNLSDEEKQKLPMTFAIMAHRP